MADSTFTANQTPLIGDITSVLKESSHAKLFLGKWYNSKDSIAVKIPYLDYDESKRQRDIDRIARVMKKILPFDHVNVVRHFHHDIGIIKASVTHRFNTLDSQFYRIPQFQIVMEYCSGGTLHDLLKISPIAARLLQKWARQLADGLAYLHERRCAHKDLKGDHIFLSSPDVNCCCLKIGGLVNLKQLLSSTTTSMYCGDITNKASSFAFMSPEMITGSEVEIEPVGETKKLGRRSDIWSLGCVLIQMITRSIPQFLKYKDNKVTAITGELAIVYFVGSGGFPTIPSDIPALLKQMIEQCLARDPNDRPTASELLQHPFFSCCTNSMEDQWMQNSPAG
ncbi:uncharacterized protein LOC129585146 [Paramacrobiotus metropolitanus]|uniref:uncharacterized protein LOC129585146 n=1 Tax=Paramacrobiotus metropolitanus TaxID=2943436 RepID=UPI002445FA1C|nr:uncharacterized protein LOC129585146 [Paramacrobiotus metropolitanus]